MSSSEPTWPPEGIRAGAITPYPHQAKAVHAILDAFKSGKKAVGIDHCTASGKTFTIGWVVEWALSYNSRVLVVAHMDELLKQLSDSLKDLGIACLYEKADQDANRLSRLFPDVRCIVGSVQTMQGDRLAAWDDDAFDLIVFDECHHVPNDTYFNLLNRFPRAWILGVTGTYFRMGKKCKPDPTAVAKVFGKPVDTFTTLEGIQTGRLCPMEYHLCPERVDLRPISRAGKDFNSGDLEDLILGDVEFIVNAIRQPLGDRRGIMFTPHVRSAELFAKALVDAGISARAVSGKSKGRGDVKDAFADGQFQVLCNAILYTEGVNTPFVEAIIPLRPTKSLGLAKQMFGRGLRTSPATGKENCKIIDFGWITSDHGNSLVSPVDVILPPGCDPGLRDRATLMLSKGEEADPAKALARAKTAMEIEAFERAKAEREEMERLRLSVRRRDVHLEWNVVNPVTAVQMAGITTKESYASRRIPATDGQCRYLMDLGMDSVNGLSRQRARELIQFWTDSAKSGGPTLTQAKHLMNRGLSRGQILKLRRREAAQLLNQMFGQHAAGAY